MGGKGGEGKGGRASVHEWRGREGKEREGDLAFMNGRGRAGLRSRGVEGRWQ